MIDEREAVIDCFKRLFDALINKDAEQLDILLSDSFVHVHMTGMKQLKEQYISGIVNGIKDYQSVIHDSIEVEVISDCATVVAKSRAQVAAYGGGLHEWNLERTIKMSVREGRWCIDEVAVIPNID